MSISIKLAKLLGIVLIAWGLVGCVGRPLNLQRVGVGVVGKNRAAVIPPLGVLYSGVKAPVSTAMRGPIGNRVGKSTAYAIGLPPNPITGWSGLDLFAWGDMSAQKALQNGGSTELENADYKLTIVLMIFRKMTLVTYGN